MKYLIVALSLISFTGRAQIAITEFEASNVKKVKVKGSFCNVMATTGSKTYVKGVINGNGNEGDYEFRSSIEGETLMLEVIKRVKRSGFRMENSVIDLMVKQGTAIEIVNSSGDINARNLQANEFTFESTSGDVDVKDIIGNTSLGSTSGDIEGSNIQGNLKGGSTSGDITISEVSGEINVKSTSGNIEITNTTTDIFAQSTSGEIELSEVKGQLEIRATSGNIEGMEIELTGDSQFRTSSGEIELDLINNIDALSFDLQASSGSLNVDGKQADKSIYLKRGGYWVNGISSSGSQRYSN
ncbi:MAG: DUF4097 family beta strand repeat protein [Cyclobacteriaceae bacterium]